MSAICTLLPSASTAIVSEDSPWSGADAPRVIRPASASTSKRTDGFEVAMTDTRLSAEAKVAVGILTVVEQEPVSSWR